MLPPLPPGARRRWSSKGNKTRCGELKSTGKQSSAAMTHNSAVVRVRLGRERGGRGEIGPWGDEREGDVGDDGTRGGPSCSAAAVVFRRSG